MRNKSLFFILLLTVAWLPSLTPAVASSAAEYELKIERQPLGQALQEFAKQSGVQIIFFSSVADGRQAPALNGRYTAAAALGRLLTGSDLTFRELNSKTIEVQPRPARESAGAAESGVRGVQLAQTRSDIAAVRQDIRLVQVDTPAAQQEADEKPDRSRDSPAGADAADRSTEVVVTGSRIRGLLGEATIQPVLTLTAEDLERTGVTTLGEALRYIPQVSTYTEGLFVQSPNSFGASSGSSTDPRVTATLRGAPAGGTLLLINGRRAPRNGQSAASTDGYDLSGIPLASVERVEVLLDGASAIYGADAIGGVINVILKRGYRGTDVRLGYANAFGTDVHTFSSSLTHGFSAGKLSGILTLSHEESGGMYWSDSDILRTQDRSQIVDGGFNGTNPQIPRANGTIRLPAGNSAGLPANTLVTIPAGSDGTNLAPGDYIVQTPPGTDMGLYAAYVSPSSRQAMVASLEYDLWSWASVFGELRASRSETSQTAQPLAVSNVSIPADAPGNVFGVPVVMRRILTDLPLQERVAETRNLGAVLGLRGEFGRDWRFEASIAPTYTRPEYENPLGFSISAAPLEEALANPDPALRPNLFYDATMPGLNPNPPGSIESLATASRSLERNTAWNYQATADGPVMDLWAGELRTAVGAEYRHEQVEFPLRGPDDLFTPIPRSRYVTGVFAEVRLPLLSERQAIPLVNRIEVMAAMRRDLYARDEFDDATKPRYGIMYRPVRWVMARASFGEGYKVPSLADLYTPERASTIFFSAANPAVDIYRGNEQLPPTLPFVAGGNPNLGPEETESSTMGLVVELPVAALRGLSFSYDWFDHKYFDRISSLGFAERLALFPELFVRGANLPGDDPTWPGQIVSYDGRSVNISLQRISGWDAGVKYVRPMSFGEVLFTYNASRVTRRENQPTPGTPPVATSLDGIPESLPLQMSSALYLKRGGMEIGALMSYRGKFTRFITQAPTPSATRWDIRAGYNFADGDSPLNSGGWFGSMLANSRVSLTVFNLLDDDPPLTRLGMPDSSLIDARGRHYSLSFTTSFGQ
jgi:outer membrane receptor protein involved in Fe transport